MNTIGPLSSAVSQTSSLTNVVAAARTASPAPAAAVEISSGARQAASSGASHGTSNIPWGSAPIR